MLLRRSGRWEAVAASLVGGLLLGAAHHGPGYGLLAWPGTMLIVLGIARAQDRRSALLGYLGASLIQHTIWFWWAFPLARAMTARGVPPVLVAFGFIFVVGLPTTALVSTGIAFLRGKLPIVAWFPFACALGERLAVGWTSVVDDWVSTQVELSRVMRLVHLVGAIPALIVCIAAAAAVGELLVTRRRALAAVPAIALLLMMVAPPLERSDRSVLEGIGVVHLRSARELPDLDGLHPKPELMVWPEQVLASRLPLEEGPTPRLPTLVPFSGSGMEHVVGATTVTPLGLQNSLLYVTPRGDIEEVRAKRVLFPIFEESFLGFGEDWLVKGKAKPHFEAAGRHLIPLVCGEVLTRTLVAEGVGAGGRIGVVSASDVYQTRTAQASWMVLSQVRLRAVEMGIPFVYASAEGQASIIDSDGAVLARSAMGAASGILTWSAEGGARDHIPELAPTTVVLYERDASHLRPDCPPGRCRYISFDEQREHEPEAATVIVSGHGTGAAIAGLSPERVATAVAAFSPKLVVLDSCFGSSTTILSAIAKKSDALVIATPSLIDGQGLVYDPSFFTTDPPERRALAVNTTPPTKIYVGRPEPAALARLEAATGSVAPEVLRADVKSWSPALVERIDEAGQRVLVPVDWQRIGQPPPPPAPKPDEPGAFAVRALWLEGSDVEHRAELDAFLRCLVERSTFESFFRGKARIAYDGSWVVPFPDGGLETENRNHALERMVLGLPPPLPGVVPVYLVFGLAAQLPLRSLCGYHDLAVVHHAPAVLSLVRTTPPCWPGAPLVRSETQIAMHEIAEGIDQALGHRGCVANGRCEGGGGCDRTCDAFTGLSCEGAPAETATGCEGQVVTGWAVQKLAHKGWDDDSCAPCVACDFAVAPR